MRNAASVPNLIRWLPPTGRGQTRHVTKSGAGLPLAILGIELDTGEFGTFPRVKPHRYR